MITITRIGSEDHHEHLLVDPNGSHHNHHHEHADHHHDHSHGQPVRSSGKTVLDLELDILYKNNLLAERNRGYFEAKNILSINLVSSPGSGKTTLLETSLHHLKKDLDCYVIEKVISGLPLMLKELTKPPPQSCR